MTWKLDVTIGGAICMTFLPAEQSLWYEKNSYIFPFLQTIVNFNFHMKSYAVGC